MGKQQGGEQDAHHPKECQAQLADVPAVTRGRIGNRSHRRALETGRVPGGGPLVRCSAVRRTRRAPRGDQRPVRATEFARVAVAVDVGGQAPMHEQNAEEYGHDDCEVRPASGDLSAGPDTHRCMMPEGACLNGIRRHL